MYCAYVTPCVYILLSDQKHQPQLTQVTVEAVKEVLRVQGQISLTHLKVIARSTHASFVEEKQEEQVDLQNGEGNVEDKQEEQVDCQNGDGEGNVENKQEEQVDCQNGEGNVEEKQDEQVDRQNGEGNLLNV